jgi:hypothetical protein
MKTRAKNLVGTKFGRWIVTNISHRDKNLAIHWECLCQCGGIKILRCDSLTSGDSQSCGCLQRERVSLSQTTHGLSGTPEHNSWNAMIQRCTHTNNQQYPRYGGAGITICKRWMGDMGISE